MFLIAHTNIRKQKVKAHFIKGDDAAAIATLAALLAAKMSEAVKNRGAKPGLIEATLDCIRLDCDKRLGEASE